MITKNSKILVCDDDETLCYLLKEQLIEEGFGVDTVYDGKYAIQAIKEFIAPIKKSYTAIKVTGVILKTVRSKITNAVYTNIPIQGTITIFVKMLHKETS